jgi:hypothetical protein
MSGGARVALIFARALKDRDIEVAGLIQAAAAQVNEVDHAKELAEDTVFIQLIGSTDYNFPEIIGYAREARDAGRTVRTIDYDGGHGLPKADLAREAILFSEFVAAASEDKPDRRRLAALVKGEQAVLAARAKDDTRWYDAVRWARQNQALMEKVFDKIVTGLEKDKRLESEATAWEAFTKSPHLANDNPGTYSKTGDALLKLVADHPGTSAAHKAYWTVANFPQRLKQFASMKSKFQKKFKELEQSFRKRVADSEP